MCYIMEQKNNKKTGDIIRELRKRLGLTQEEFAEAIGISNTYLAMIESGKRKGKFTLQKVADKFGVNIEVLEGKQPLPAELRPKPLKAALSEIEVSIKSYMPVYAEVSAGEGIEAIDHIALTRTRPAPPSLRAYRVKGLCLAPEIAEGDTLIVDTARSPESGDLVVVIIDGQASVKRFKESENGKWLENNNGSYKPEDVHIHGVVVEFNRKLR